MESNEQLLFRIADGLFKAAKDAQARYDTAKTVEECSEIRILRRLVTKDIPRLIERFVNEDTQEKWSMWEWYSLKTKINKNVLPRQPWWKRIFKLG